MTIRMTISRMITITTIHPEFVASIHRVTRSITTMRITRITTTTIRITLTAIIIPVHQSTSASADLITGTIAVGAGGIAGIVGTIITHGVIRTILHTRIITPITTGVATITTTTGTGTTATTTTPITTITIIPVARFRLATTTVSRILQSITSMMAEHAAHSMVHAPQETQVVPRADRSTIQVYASLYMNPMAI